MQEAFVSLTFDDGWTSAIERADPLLSQHRFPATFYIISERIDNQFREYMNIRDLRRLANHGHEIGVHTVEYGMEKLLAQTV